MKPLLELNHVSYAYHSESGETAALSDLSFQVFPGEFIAVIGPSGCGKSTLLSLIAGLLLPESGTILYAQERVRKSFGYNRTRPAPTGKKRKNSLLPDQSDKSSIGYMLQKDHLFEWRTIYRNVLLGLEIQHRLDENALARVDKMLQDYGLEQFRNARPSELSGGMRQRAALIRTLAPDPELLLLDEPFSALDYQTRLSVCDDVSAILRREKKTALLVTHDLSEAISMADRILVLTKRPARIRTILTIRFARETPDKTLSGMPPFEQETPDRTPSGMPPFEQETPDRTPSGMPP
ncbi:MAG: ABC transporter ATP-binding protein, partial [Lachnospiraceae bacterium]|nr:ABC transporter ATP-binding protein [Lachnospiraceae bacterium]